MNRTQARKLFETTVPAQFIADTTKPERDEIKRMLADSTTFFENCAEYQVVAEVVEATRCMAGVRVGDRYVVQGAAIDLEQSTGPNCIFLISMLVQRVAAAFDRFGSTGDIGLTLPGAQCTDPGPWSVDSAASKSKCGSSPYPVNETLEEQRR